MSKKYKLKQWYPGLPKNWKKGTVVEQGDEGVHWMYYAENNIYNTECKFPKEIEDNPDFWAEYKFTTIDEVDIFAGDSYWFSTQVTEGIVYGIASPERKFPNKKGGFSTKEAAHYQEYLDKQKFNLTFGGHKVELRLSGKNIFITCNGHRGIYEELLEIKKYITKRPSFGGKKLRDIETEHGRFVYLDYLQNKIIKITLGCTRGTWEEFNNIITACKKLLQ